MKNYISVNVVSQSLLLINSIKKNYCYSKKEIRLLKLPYGINHDIATAFALQCGWLLDDGTSLSFTEVGAEIESQFNGESIGPKLWKIILSTYISECHPAWSARIPYGRTEAFIFMNEEEQRCFLEAGLIDNFDDDVISWWDSLAEIVRMKNSVSKDDIGRTGEKLTLKYEEERTGVKPNWKSIETNLCGYDILSQKSSTDTSQLLIEVKSSTRSINDAEAIISRNEWDIASLENNNDRYLFYFWCLYSETNKLAIISVDQMRNHIPADQESGKWESMSIPFSIFEKFFSKINNNNKPLILKH